MSMNDRFNIIELQPASDDQRGAVATRCCDILSHPWPMLIDSIDDKVGNDYSAFPDRLYLIDAEGRVAYKSGRGPFGYSPTELEQALVLLQIDQKRQAAAAPPAAEAVPPAAPPAESPPQN